MYPGHRQISNEISGYPGHHLQTGGYQHTLWCTQGSASFVSEGGTSGDFKRNQRMSGYIFVYMWFGWLCFFCQPSESGLVVVKAASLIAACVKLSSEPATVHSELASSCSPAMRMYCGGYCVRKTCAQLWCVILTPLRQGNPINRSFNCPMLAHWACALEGLKDL